MKRKKLIKALFIFVNILIFVDFSRVNAAGPQVKTTEVKKFIILEHKNLQICMIIYYIIFGFICQTY